MPQTPINSAIALFCLLSAQPLFSYGQQLSAFKDQNYTSPTDVSKITYLNESDTLPWKVKLPNARYDGRRRYLPYYSTIHSTDLAHHATAQLEVKKTVALSADRSAAIKRIFAGEISSTFTLTPVNGDSRGVNHNRYRVYPFRLNSAGDVEELTDFDITWTEAPVSKPARRQPPPAQSSVLASGSWYKIAVTQDGIHRIGKGLLASMGMDVHALDPTKIRIYGNGGHMLPELNSAPRADDLVENPIYVSGESDHSFDNDDYVLFYATGPDSWQAGTGALKFTATKNLYSDTSYYFLNADIGPGKRIAHTASLQNGIGKSSSSYDYRVFHEEDVINFGKTGRGFYGEFFDVNSSYRFAWSDGDYVVGDPLVVEVTLLANYVGSSTTFNVAGNGVSFDVVVPANTTNQYAPYALQATGSKSSPNGNASEIAITISKRTAASVGWLDKLTVNARRQLRVNGKQFNFRDTRSVDSAAYCTFHIANPALANLQIWNVTDPLNPFVQDYNTTGANVDFTASSNELQEYCVAPPTDYLVPSFVARVTNQNLHALASVKYLVVTHPLFLAEAQRIAAFHQKQEGMSSAVATIDQIYNEFSSGRPDISGIRDFIRMLYQRGTSADDSLRYVLLMGDGSFNNKSRSLVNNSNLIPTYQSQETLSSTSSIGTDDFYALMGDNEGYLAEEIGEVDLGIGRFTCRTVTECHNIVDKVEHYYQVDPTLELNSTTPENCNNLNESPMGDWRNWVLFMADDGDAALHMDQSNNLSDILRKYYPVANIDKIFLDAYQRFSTPGGSRYPDASADFVKRIKKGVLLFNYTGHGGEVGLTAERLVDLDIINGFDNYNRLAFFVTATCEFSRYDDPQRTSAGELCLLNPKGGAIALMTTSRLAYSGTNFDLNETLLQMLFQHLPDGKWPALGDVIRKTKAKWGQDFTYANFILLGDPAVTLSYPRYKVVTTSINSHTVPGSAPDTLSPLTKFTITGYVADTTGAKLTNFNGLAYPSVFDKEQQLSGLLNSSESQFPSGSGKPFTFKMQKNMLYRGKSRVQNGDFSFTFIVPKDISAEAGAGRISLYATNGLIDAAGSFTDVMVGGEQRNTIADDAGPQATLFMNDKNFVPGGLTNEKPVLYADLTDSSGINTVGSGLGHDITVVLDDITSKPIVVNDYYEANLNSYQSGRVRYPFDQLAEGPHKLSFKVWDIQNNSNVVSTDFVVAKSAELALRHVLNYPNPFTTATKFMFEHNQACNPLKVTIQIYTISGKLVKTIQQSVLCEGYRPEPISWDGRDDFGDRLARGVYIYRLGILDVNNKHAEKIEKLVILN